MACRLGFRSAKTWLDSGPRAMRTSMRLLRSRPVHRQPLEPAIRAGLVDSDHATVPAGVRSPCAGRTQAAQLGHRLSHSIVCADSHDPVLRRPLSLMRSGNGQGSSSTSIAIHSSHGCSSHRRKRSLMPCSTPTSTSGGGGLLANGERCPTSGALTPQSGRIGCAVRRTLGSLRRLAHRQRPSSLRARGGVHLRHETRWQCRRRDCRRNSRHNR